MSENELLIAKFREESKVQTSAGAGRRMLRRILDFLINVAIERAKAANPNFDEAAARAALEEAIKEIGDGMIWEWLVNGGFEQVLKWIMLILDLFA